MAAQYRKLSRMCRLVYLRVQISEEPELADDRRRLIAIRLAPQRSALHLTWDQIQEPDPTIADNHQK